MLISWLRFMLPSWTLVFFFCTTGIETRAIRVRNRCGVDNVNVFLLFVLPVHPMSNTEPVLFHPIIKTPKADWIGPTISAENISIGIGLKEGKVCSSHLGEVHVDGCSEAVSIIHTISFLPNPSSYYLLCSLFGALMKGK